MMTRSLSLSITDCGEGPVFDRFFDAYDRAFVLPDEKESREGLVACLALNHGAAHAELRERYGPFRELCVIATEGEGGDFVGGANFIAMPCAAGEGDGRIVTANLNYLFIDGAARGKGHMRGFVAALTGLIAGFFSDPAEAAARALIFIEQNDPFRMTPQAYARDTAFTGIDQFDRLAIWARQGARVVDFPYVQPPLSAEQAPDASLVYSVLGAAEPSLPAALLAHHLRGFFGISVLKGTPLDHNPVAQEQIARLAGMGAGKRIALLDPAAALATVQGDPAAFVASAQAATFRDWVRRDQPGRSMVS